MKKMFEGWRITRPKRYYTAKEWKRFDRVHEKWVGNTIYYLDVQETLCKKFDIILTDYKTGREKILSVIKGFNMKNFDKGMKIFDDVMKDFDDMMKDFGKELGASDKVAQDRIVGKKRTTPKVSIWSTQKKTASAKRRRKKSKTRKKSTSTDVEKLVGKRKPIF